MNETLTKKKLERCHICLDECPELVSLCCGCTSHYSCYNEWASKKNSCTCCLIKIKSTESAFTPSVNFSIPLSLLIDHIDDTSTSRYIDSENINLTQALSILTTTLRNTRAQTNSNNNSNNAENNTARRLVSASRGNSLLTMNNHVHDQHDAVIIDGIQVGEYNIWKFALPFLFIFTFLGFLWLYLSNTFIDLCQVCLQEIATHLVSPMTVADHGTVRNKTCSFNATSTNSTTSNTMNNHDGFSDNLFVNCCLTSCTFVISGAMMLNVLVKAFHRLSIQHLTRVSSPLSTSGQLEVTSGDIGLNNLNSGDASTMPTSIIETDSPADMVPVSDR